MRRLWIALAPVVLLASAGPAAAQVTVLDAAASALRTNPVYVDAAAEREGDVDADRLRARIRRGDAPIFVAVLPAAAIDDAGGDVNRLPRVLSERVGLRGTYAVVAGSSFRADSNDIPATVAQRLATAAFPARSDDGVGAVLENYVDRVSEAATGASEPGVDTPADDGDGRAGRGGLLLLLGLGGGGLFLWSRGRRRREQQQEQKEFAADRQLLQAELSVLGNDVLELEPQVTTHPDARPDYDAGVTRYQSAQAAMEYADDQVDLVRVERVIDEGRYAMARARAHIDGRGPPAPPDNLTRPGRHDEPALEIDDRGIPAYAGYGGMPWYGVGWFGGGGGGLLTGLMLGGMLGGGWSGRGGYGPVGTEPTGDGNDDGGWTGTGGGDFGGGGDVGGGDW